MKHVNSTFAVIFAIIFLSLHSNAQLLYKVEGNGLEKPSYVFGTHHLAPLSVIDTFGARLPFLDSEQIVGEIDMTGDKTELAKVLQAHAIAPSDSTLSKVISKEDFEIISKEFKNWTPTPGLELSMLDMAKPLMISNIVVVAMTSKLISEYDSTKQLDEWFQSNAKMDGKNVIALETAEQQATLLFDLTPISMQASSLVELLKNPSKAMASTKALTEAYMNQNLNKMLELSKEDNDNPEFMSALLDKRNADWLEKLPALFKQGSSFVAVGALHLAGEKGIIAGLKKKGYKLTPLTAADQFK